MVSSHPFSSISVSLITHIHYCSLHLYPVLHLYGYIIALSNLNSKILRVLGLVLVLAAQPSLQISINSAVGNKMLLSACNYLVNSFGRGSGLERFQLKLKMQDMHSILRELNWLGLFSKDMYFQFVKKTILDNLDFKTLLHAIAGELGFLEGVIRMKLNAEGKIVDKTLIDLSSLKYGNAADDHGKNKNDDSMGGGGEGGGMKEGG